MLNDSKYDWDEHNLGHIARHNVKPEEVEQALTNAPEFVETRIQGDEIRVLELGHTDAGRVLFVASTPRGTLTRPVTAWDASRKVRTEYKARKLQ
jgi:uncharacterized protein